MICENKIRLRGTAGWTHYWRWKLNCTFMIDKCCYRSQSVHNRCELRHKTHLLHPARHSFMSGLFPQKFLRCSKFQNHSTSSLKTPQSCFSLTVSDSELVPFTWRGCILVRPVPPANRIYLFVIPLFSLFSHEVHQTKWPNVFHDKKLVQSSLFTLNVSELS